MGNKRLRRVESSLAPTQAVVLWMEEVDRFPSVVEYACSLQGEPESAYPLYRLPQQVDDAVRGAMRGQPREQIDAAAHRAVRDVVFLFFLHQEANQRMENDRRANVLMVALLASQLSLCRERERSGRDRLVEWRTMARDVVRRLNAWRHALSTLTERYFSGHDVLFPDVRAEWEGTVDLLRQVVEICNDMAATADPKKKRSARKSRPHVVDLSEADTALAQQIVRDLVDHARVEALRMVNEHTQANDYLDEQIVSRIDAR